MPFQPFTSDWDRAAWSDGQQWTWLAVEITEIRRCAEVGDRSHDRIAFILADHLVEVIVGREVDKRLAMQPADSVVDDLREAQQNGYGLSPGTSKLINEYVSPAQRRRLDGHLHEKTKFLVKHGVLTPDERVVLNRMHEYRNALYHQDTLEVELISDLVLAYMLLAGQLLARHQPLLWTIASSTGNVVTPGQLPDMLTAGLEMDLAATAARFGDHAANRVEAIARAVDTATALHLAAGDLPPSQDWTPLEVSFAGLLRDLQGVAPHLCSWHDRAQGLRTNPGTFVKLMVRYTGLDRALSAAESSARRLAAIIDKYQQAHLDEIRGK